jgi:excisionase family DNA binding protein
LTERARYRVAEASELTGLGVPTIRRAIHRGDLEATKPKGSSVWLIEPAALDQWLDFERAEQKGAGHGQHLPSEVGREGDRAAVDRAPRDRRYVSRSCRTRSEAKAELAKLFDEHVTGANLTKLSLGAYLRRWLDESARPTISANTYRGYDDVLTHLAPIAEIPLAKVTAEDIERCLAGMVTHRGKTRSPASAKTVRNAQVMLRRALGQAEQRGHVRHNVARQVPLRRVPRSTRDALSPEVAKRILEAVAGDEYEAAYALAMIGLRASEILGLARSDVRLEAPASVNVHRQVAGSGKGARMAELKTAASEAPVPLPPFVVTRLRPTSTRSPCRSRTARSSTASSS